jgi:cellulose 1,4-beta-cellobiosidase
VGISDLTVTSTPVSFTYSSESASTDGGGGVSVEWSIPAYQMPLATAAAATAGSKVSTTHRNLPDVAFTADPSTCYSFYMSIPGQAGWYGFWGSSLAAPIWASFISLVNEKLGASGPIGFANTSLYQIAQTANYTSDFHDITTGNNGYYPAEPGYSDATGLGSFNGVNLYNALVSKFNPTTIPPTPTGLTATTGNAQVALSWSASSGATSYNVYRASGSGGTYTEIAAVTSTTYTNRSLTNGTTYYYEVSAVNSAGSSANSSSVSATPSAPVSVVAPTALSGSATTYAGRLAALLRWTQSSSSNIKFNNVYYSIGSGGYVKLGGISATTTVTVTGLRNGIVYNFYVTAVNSSGVESPASNKVTVI